MDEIAEFIKKHGGGRFAVSYEPRVQMDTRHWTVGVEFGREAEDSDMAAGASYGIGETLEEALAQVREELGIRG